MFQAACGVDRLVLEVELNAVDCEWQDVQVGVGAAIGVGVDPPDRFGDPGTLLGASPGHRLNLVDIVLSAAGFFQPLSHALGALLDIASQVIAQWSEQKS